MNVLQNRNIEYLLSLIKKAEIPLKSFGDVCNFMSKSLVSMKSDERHRAFFRFFHNPDYTIAVEAKSTGLYPESGKVQGVSVDYFQKHPMRKDIALFSVPKTLQEPTQNLESIFANAKNCHLGVNYVADALVRAGFTYSAVRNDRNANLTGEFIMADLRTIVNVDLREVALHQPSTFCRDWELHTSVKVRPFYDALPVVKKKAIGSKYDALFSSQAAVARP